MHSALQYIVTGSLEPRGLNSFHFAFFPPNICGVLQCRHISENRIMNFYESPRLVVILIRITMINIERIDSFPILKHVIHTYNEFVHLFGSFKFPLTMIGHRDFVSLLLDLFLIIIWGCCYEKCRDRLKIFSQFLFYLNKIHTSEALLSNALCRTF